MKSENNYVYVPPANETQYIPLLAPIQSTQSTQPTKSQKKILPAIVVVVFLISMCSLALYAYQYLKPEYLSSTNLNEAELLTQQEAGQNGCAVSNQSATGSVINLIETRYTNDLQAIDLYTDESQKITARVLNESPFIIEIYETGSSDYIFDDYGIQENMFVDFSEKNSLSLLKFNDIITADLYKFTYASTELAIGTAIKNIKKVDKIDGISENPFANRSGTLIRYRPSNTNSNGILLIFNDGRVFYRDSNNNIFTDKTLTKMEIDQVLKSFSSVNFDNIATDYNVSLYEPSLLLVCNRYQKIQVKGAANLDPVIAELDKIIESYRSSAEYTLEYDKKYLIKDWQYSSIVPLNQANVTTFRQQNRERLSQINPSAELLKEVEELTTYYRDESKFYGVYFGSCVDGTTGSWACFGANELKTKNPGSRYYDIWPTKLSIKLKDVPREGISISSEEYNAHKDFYDRLLAGNSNLLFLEGDYLYQRLSVSLH
jgi:hypothetical protein